MATSTYQTYLCKKSSSSYTKILDIKSFPDLGGSPELIETTTLSDKMQTNISGVQSLDALEFTANYTKADYTAVKNLSSSSELDLAVMVTEDGLNYFPFEWKGELDVFVAGGEVNAVLEMTITSVAHNEIKLSSTSHTATKNASGVVTGFAPGSASA